MFISVFSVHGIYTSMYNILPDLLTVERLLAMERSISEEPVLFLHRHGYDFAIEFI